LDDTSRTIGLGRERGSCWTTSSNRVNTYSCYSDSTIGFTVLWGEIDVLSRQSTLGMEIEIIFREPKT
jgi:hypothetical protein